MPQESVQVSPSKPRATENRSTVPQTNEFAEYIGSNWAEHPRIAPEPREAASYAAARRARISALHPGRRLVIPASPARVRSNDTDYAYRAHSAFAWLTGWGSDTVPDSILILEPAADGGHTATLHLREAAGRDSDEFYANPEIGEFWVGPRPALDDVAVDLGLATGSLRAFLADGIESLDWNVPTSIVRDADASLTKRVDTERHIASTRTRLEQFADGGGLGAGDAIEASSADLEQAEASDAALARDLSELRLTKDAYEIAEMRAAIEATRIGFDDVIADLPQVIAHPRGERVVEGTFNRRARMDGNTVGYDTIAASGPHACVLHWTRNDGPVVPGDLILIDAGIELDSYYTADITRTLPVSGKFTEVQRKVYEAVREAADAAFAIVRPGIVFREVHAAAMQVIAARTAEWGLLPVSAEESLASGQYHRRYMVHGTSHHLGLDVHDCAQARREFYADGVVEEGMIFTIEPGLYFQPDDLTVPEEFRGIGVRIEDDVLVTADGVERLSAAIPRTADEVEAWLAGR